MTLTSHRFLHFPSKILHGQECRNYARWYTLTCTNLLLSAISLSVWLTYCSSSYWLSHKCLFSTGNVVHVTFAFIYSLIDSHLGKYVNFHFEFFDFDRLWFKLVQNLNLKSFWSWFIIFWIFWEFSRGFSYCIPSKCKAHLNLFKNSKIHNKFPRN